MLAGSTGAAYWRELAARAAPGVLIVAGVLLLAWMVWSEPNERHGRLAVVGDRPIPDPPALAPPNPADTVEVQIAPIPEVVPPTATIAVARKPVPPKKSRTIRAPDRAPRADPDHALVAAFVRRFDGDADDTVARAPSGSIGELVAGCRRLRGPPGDACLRRICAGVWGQARACPGRPAKSIPRKGVR